MLPFELSDQQPLMKVEGCFRVEGSSDRGVLCRAWQRIREICFKMLSSKSSSSSFSKAQQQLNQHTILSSMASRTCTRAFKGSFSRQLASSTAQRRTFVSALNNSRGAVSASLRPAVSTSLTHARGLKQIDFAGHKETVYGKLLLQWTS